MTQSWKPQAPLFEQVNFMRHKIQLMDGDRKAYYDATFQKLMKEHNKLVELRSQVKILRNDVRDRKHPDEFITDQALQRQPKERQAMIKYSAMQAMEIMDSQVNDTMKKLNMLRHKSLLKRQKLRELEENYTKLLIQASDEEDLKARQGKVGQKLRDMENRLDKAFLKQNEALHVNATYLKIKDMIKQESITYNLTLDAMGKEIVKSEEDLKQVKALQSDSILARNHDLVELRRHEEFIITELKRRELELSNLKQMAQSKKFQALQNRVVVPMEISFGDQEDLSKKSEENSVFLDENNVKLKKQEDLFQIIKQATGISNLNQMIKRFQAQVNTSNNLENLRVRIEGGVLSKRNEKEDVLREYLNQKFCFEEKNLRHLQTKTEKELKSAERSKYYESIVKDLATKELLLSKIRMGIEHLAQKCDKKVDRNVELYDIKFYNRTIDKICNEILLFISEMKDYDIAEESLKVKEEENEVILMTYEFSLLVENRLNPSNTRIKFHTTLQKEGLVEEESDNEERADVVTRQTLKKQCKKILEAKSKKRVNLL